MNEEVTEYVLSGGASTHRSLLSTAAINVKKKSGAVIQRRGSKFDPVCLISS